MGMKLHHQYSHIDTDRIYKTVHGKKIVWNWGCILQERGGVGGGHGFANVWHSHLSNGKYSYKIDSKNTFSFLDNYSVKCQSVEREHLHQNMVYVYSLLAPFFDLGETKAPVIWRVRSVVNTSICRIAINMCEARKRNLLCAEKACFLDWCISTIQDVQLQIAFYLCIAHITASSALNRSVQSLLISYDTMA